MDGNATPHLLERDGFWQAGCTLGAMTLGLCVLLVHDVVILRRIPDVASARGVPWLTTLAAGAAAAHGWLLVAAAGRATLRHRLSRAQLAAGALVAGAVGSLWVVFWMRW